MLLFSTILDVEKTLTKEAFIKLVLEWNQGSPHESNVIKEINWNGERNIKYGDEKLWMEIEEYRNKNIIAVRFEKVEEDGAVWDSDYVMNFQDMKMSIRLDRSYLEEALIVDSKFSAPYFITLLIERGFVKRDGLLDVLKKPIFIDDTNIQMLADIINGEKNYKLPVVYISKTYNDEDPVNVGLLANKLKGVAHILVQKSKSTNNRLKVLCNNNNEYFGAIGIYFPNQAMRRVRYLYRFTTGIDNYLLEKVIRVVIQYCNSQMVETLYTWQGVNNSLLRDRLLSQKEERVKIEEERRKALYELLRIKGDLDKTQEKMQQKAIEEAKTEADKILDGFEEDMQKLQEQVEQLSRMNDALTSENYGLRSKINSVNKVPVIFLGDEEEFYPGEIKEMILDAVNESSKSVAPKTRRNDVFNDILEKNMYEGVYEKREKIIKNIFKDYKTMSGVMRQELKDIGFEITDDGKHYRLTYYGDERYKTTVAKTGSDWREGKNIASNILKDMM